MIKSFEEIKKIVEKFPEASGVGYVITPQLLKIATKLRLDKGYQDALIQWFDGGVLFETVYEDIRQAIENGARIIVNWEGAPLIQIKNRDKNTVYIIGLKALLAEVEQAAKVF